MFNNLSPNKKSRYEELLEVFDKQYIEDLFEEAKKIGLYPSTQPIQGTQYVYKGYLYTITRQRMI